MNINKVTAILGTGLAILFLLGLTVTLRASSMIGFFDILPVYIIMAISITMMLCEVLLQFGIHLDEKIEKKLIASNVLGTNILLYDDILFSPVKINLSRSNLSNSIFFLVIAFKFLIKVNFELSGIAICKVLPSILNGATKFTFI